MPPESEDYLSIARRDLDDAKTILKIGIARVAARSAYFAVFHAAEAAIFGLTGKIAKTHSGVHSEYARVSRDRPGLANAPHAFLAMVYRYKQEGDYGTGDTEVVSTDTARTTIDKAELLSTRSNRCSANDSSLQRMDFV